MPESTYRVVWDVTNQSWLSVRASIIVAVVLLIGGLLLWFHGRIGAASSEKNTERSRLQLAIIAFLFIAMVVNSVVRSECDSLRKALKDGRARRVEGVVQAFVPEPPGGHSPERFTVAGQQFEYTTSEETCAFHRTSREGGPIRPGIQVRIHEVHGRIVRLEIATNAAADSGRVGTSR